MHFVVSVMETHNIENSHSAETNSVIFNIRVNLPAVIKLKGFLQEFFPGFILFF